MDLSTLFGPQNLAVIAVLVGVVEALKRLAPLFFASPQGKRLLPMIPLALGMIAGVLGLCAQTPLPAGANPLADHLMTGFLVGLAAAGIFKVGKTSLLGQGLVTTEPTPSTPPTPPPPAPLPPTNPPDAPPAA